jgi:hypothetical protein
MKTVDELGSEEYYIEYFESLAHLLLGVVFSWRHFVERVENLKKLKKEYNFNSFLIHKS